MNSFIMALLAVTALTGEVRGAAIAGAPGEKALQDAVMDSEEMRDIALSLVFGLVPDEEDIPQDVVDEVSQTLSEEDDRHKRESTMFRPLWVTRERNAEEQRQNALRGLRIRSKRDVVMPVDIAIAAEEPLSRSRRGLGGRGSSFRLGGLRRVLRGGLGGLSSSLLGRGRLGRSVQDAVEEDGETGRQRREIVDQPLFTSRDLEAERETEEEVHGGTAKSRVRRQTLFRPLFVTRDRHARLLEQRARRLRQPRYSSQQLRDSLLN